MAGKTVGIEVVPILSRGRHRDPRRGGCFMEYASYLAGVPWSDSPDCTHPLLALIGREVNDEMSDAGRTMLVPLVPAVIGVNPSHPEVVPALVARCARPVVPFVSEQFGAKLVAAVQKAEAVREDLRKPEPTQLSVGYEWEAPLAVAGAIRAITDFRVPTADALLHQILTEAIAEARQWMPAAPLPIETVAVLR
ncbi:hypothetical protein [Kribbella sp. CA-293567]|uniref:hypothetical protein n=1 Tax=Kribbella sp. CA-293567 TaxID=3002436 RepID=UPI0022DD437C|nr:hypothetical protein [Kribbella sp. CA-293567]WBQ04496.1 hypothetical protein OX958_31600 [Kribbella sp. CA-293567]